MQRVSDSDDSLKMTTYSLKENNHYNFADEEDLSDEEVFISNSGKRAMDEENGVNKPLMAPRRKHGTNSKLHTEIRRNRFSRGLCLAGCYILVAIASVIGIICLVVFLVNIFTTRLKFRDFLTMNRPIKTKSDPLVGCTHFEVEDIWIKNFPKLLTESAIRLLDVNQDGTLDAVIGFGTGADGYQIPKVVCDVYFEGIQPCFGGLLALDGANGDELWRHYMDHEVFAVNCNIDLNNDTVLDCLAAGRAGVFAAVNGKTGKRLWNFGPQKARNEIMNVYTAQYISDKDGDGVPDIIVIHGGDPLADPGSAHRLAGRILLLSGHDGRVIRWMSVPDRRESYYSPQILTAADGTELLLFGTGGETHPGSLWYVPLTELLRGNASQANAIYTDSYKGIMTPPVIVDVNGDGTKDIVMAMFNSTVVAFDGLNFQQIWNYSFPLSESYSTPAVGFFNDDGVPDFLVKYQHGPGFPIYWYTQTTVLDGRDGQPLWPTPFKESIGAQASGLTIAMEGKGNDVFLYWSGDCFAHEGKGTEFHFVKGTNVHEQSRADMCRMRFNTSVISKLYAVNQHINPPGFVVYSSETRKTVEYQNVTNTSAVAQEYLQTHPDIWAMYQQYEGDSEADLLYGLGLLPDIAGVSEDTDSLIQESPYYNHAHRTENRHQTYQGEYSENIPYQEPHSVRKHGRYRHGDNRYSDLLAKPQSDLVSNWNEYAGGKSQDQWPAKYGIPQGSYQSTDYDMNAEDASGQRYPLLSGDSPYSDPYRYQGRRKSSRLRNRLGRDVKWTRKRKLSSRARTTDKPESGKKRRRKRHVGPHDVDGIQRLISTGTLAPVLSSASTEANHSIDIIFATYWFFPSKAQTILPEDRDCIQKGMAIEEQRFRPENQYYGMDDDAYEEAITQACLEHNKHTPTTNRIYQSQTDFNPFNIHMGQMTVYRLRIKCTCADDPRVSKAGRKCAKILPYQHQPWAAYMGSQGDSIHRTTRIVP